VTSIIVQLRTSLNNNYKFLLRVDNICKETIVFIMMERKKDKKFFKLLRFLRPHIVMFIGLFFIMLFRSFVEGASIGTLSPILRVLFSMNGAPEFLTRYRLLQPINNFLMSFIFSVPKMVALKRLAILIFGIYIFKFLFLYLDNIINVALGEGIVKSVRDRLFKKMLKLPLSFFNRVDTGDIMARFLNDANYIRMSYINGISVIIRDALVLIVLLSLAVVVSWQLSVFAFLIIPLGGFFLFFVSNHLRKRARRVQEKMGNVTQHLSESIDGIKIIKGYSTENLEENKFQMHTRNYFKSAMRLAYLNALSSPLTELITAIIGVGLIFFGGKLILINKTLSPDQFFVFIAATLSLLGPFKRILNANSFVQQGISASDRISDILDQGENIEYTGVIKFTGLKDRIEFRDIWYAYNGNKYVLKGINLSVKRGERIAIVGPTGAGKSTLMDILAKFYIPQRGSVFIDGIDIKKLNTDSYRNKISIITQKVFLFSDTLLSNVAYGNKRVTSKEVIQAIKRAGGDIFLSKLPEGINSFIGEGGSLVSGGERQRIAIVRALLRNPEIIIMDEPTSSLDSESEETIKKMIYEVTEGRTSFIIAHRLSTVLFSDRIVVLDEGKIIDSGRHNELLGRCELYKRLYKLQFEPTKS